MSLALYQQAIPAPNTLKFKNVHQCRLKKRDTQLKGGSHDIRREKELHTFPVLLLHLGCSYFVILHAAILFFSLLSLKLCTLLVMLLYLAYFPLDSAVTLKKYVMVTEICMNKAKLN